MGVCDEELGDEAPSIRPHRDEWRVEADFAFGAEVQAITIGGRLTGGATRNFANKGDVIVEVDGAPGRIVIEMRRFTAALCEAAAREDYEALDLSAFRSAGEAPLRPEDLDSETSCLLGEWRDDCEIRVVYDGISQLARAGADLRVTLPADYRGEVIVVTEDNDDDPDYANRGDVCIQGLSGAADVELDSGRAFVSLARDATPWPQCPKDDLDRCEAWPCADPDDACDGAQAWAPECPCVAAGVEPGRVLVQSGKDRAADITVDVPPHLWATIVAFNRDSTQLHRDPSDRCAAVVDVSGYVETRSPVDRLPWLAQGHVGYPGPWADPEGGVQIGARSSACALVPHTDKPEDFAGTQRGDTQATERRGDLHVCSGCLTATPCDVLVP